MEKNFCTKCVYFNESEQNPNFSVCDFEPYINYATGERDVWFCKSLNPSGNCKNYKNNEVGENPHLPKDYKEALEKKLETKIKEKEVKDVGTADGSH